MHSKEDENMSELIHEKIFASNSKSDTNVHMASAAKTHSRFTTKSIVESPAP